MKNIRFNQTKVGECRYLKTRLRPNDSINNQVVDLLFDNSDFKVLPIKTCTEYDGIVEILLNDDLSLDFVIKNNIERNVMLTLVFNLIKELSGLVRKGVKLEYIVFNKRYIYVNPKDLSIRFVCVPIDNVEHKVDFRIFLRGLLASAVYSEDVSLEYVGRLLNLVNSAEYTNTKFVELIREIGGDDIGKPMPYGYNEEDIEKVSKNNDSVAGEITEVNMFDREIEDHELAKAFEKARADYAREITKGVPGDTREVPILTDEQIKEASEAIAAEKAAKKAAEMEQEEVTPYQPYLIRMSTREKILIDKDRFNLGKSPMSNHYVIDNDRVSRYHCAIVYRNGRYYIKDNGSTNCTYVNGVDIGDLAVELVNNTSIHIANEEFLFIFA